MMGALWEHSRSHAPCRQQCPFPPSHDRVEVVRGTPLMRAVVNSAASATAPRRDGYPQKRGHKSPLTAREGGDDR